MNTDEATLGKLDKTYYYYYPPPPPPPNMINDFYFFFKDEEGRLSHHFCFSLKLISTSLQERLERLQGHWTSGYLINSALK